MAGKAKNYILPELGSVAVSKLTKGRIERWLFSVAESPARVRVISLGERVTLAPRITTYPSTCG